MRMAMQSHLSSFQSQVEPLAAPITDAMHCSGYSWIAALHRQPEIDWHLREETAMVTGEVCLLRRT